MAGSAVSLVEAPGGRGRRYAAALDSPQGTGERMFALALQCGYGTIPGCTAHGMERPWIAQQAAAVFPRQSFLPDRYLLLEHLHDGASALMGGDAESSTAWVAEQARRIDRGEAARVVAECRREGGIPWTGWPATWRTGRDSWTLPPRGGRVCPSGAGRWKGAIAT